ncbi:hypothetical protein QBC46DRAFT_416737 [Diplogelasinospora grovesii]|uniref:Uncharacterized protein n=1 Tax=Diplogelasinospora grovesii TaxID=303347 RepID=A0AAN6NGX8_9PEZI|nr:hypothetical protein QBC46DRAFT_416737 [Diplogelasinospora grovesii]
MDDSPIRLEARHIYNFGLAIFTWHPARQDWVLLLTRLGKSHEYAGYWDLPYADVDYDEDRVFFAKQYMPGRLDDTGLVDLTENDWKDLDHYGEVIGRNTPLFWCDMSSAVNFEYRDEPGYERRNYVLVAPTGMKDKIRLGKEHATIFDATKWPTVRELQDEGQAHKTPMRPRVNTSLGFDLSTQQLKATVIQSDLTVVSDAKVDLSTRTLAPKYGITKGVLVNEAEGEVFAPVAMCVTSSWTVRKEKTPPRIRMCRAGP